ncbi:hypothetical protein [Olivibacter sp. XZL3]|uniref:hypothetical protein n=1 Tax=Olivibacter sp. XZL3 TaxID=1735116 RepID=UPI001066851A|nr:hypothetical protein [Olivibacter sp. XZL3]
MKLAINILGGLAGALVLNAIHEGAKRAIPSAPEINKVGEEAITKVSKAAGMPPPAGKKLYTATLAGDLVSNAIYYSAIGKGDKQTLLLRGAGYGLIAGLGVIGLTKPLGLDDEPINKSMSTKFLTVLWYTLGGIVAASAIKLLDNTAD